MILTNIFTNKVARNSLLLTAALGSVNVASAGESQQLEQRIERLEQQLEQQAKNQSAQIQTDNQMSVKFYSTLRPSLTWSDSGDDSNLDVTDFLSFAGIYTEADIGDGWTAIALGEWSIDIPNNGNFGKARRAYVGIDSPYGRVAIGKQRAVDYLLHATYVDIFNHGLSPFAYDYSGGGFFTSNQVSYRNSWDNISFMAAVQYDGADNGVDYGDKSIAGLSYDNDGLHLAASFKTQKRVALDNVDTVTVSFANSFDNGFYLALAYQDKEEADSLDLSMAYQLNAKYKLKAGYFNFDDGMSSSDSRAHDGLNLTLERQFTPKFRVHVELLTRNFDNFEDETAVTIGFKYDLSLLWRS